MKKVLKTPNQLQMLHQCKGVCLPNQGHNYLKLNIYYELRQSSQCKCESINKNTKMSSLSSSLLSSWLGTHLSTLPLPFCSPAWFIFATLKLVGDVLCRCCSTLEWLLMHISSHPCLTWEFCLLFLEGTAWKLKVALTHESMSSRLSAVLSLAPFC